MIIEKTRNELKEKKKNKKQQCKKNALFHVKCNLGYPIITSNFQLGINVYTSCLPCWENEEKDHLLQHENQSSNCNSTEDNLNLYDTKEVSKIDATKKKLRTDWETN